MLRQEYINNTQNIKHDPTLNEKYGVVNHWRLQLKYYLGYGTYLEAYSIIKNSWIVVKRVSLFNITV